MQYLPLGTTGLYVSRICLGTVTFSEQDSQFADMIGATGQELADRMVAASFDAGVNFFDTANMYGFGQSDVMLGKAHPGPRPRQIHRGKRCPGCVSGAGPGTCGGMPRKSGCHPYGN